MQISKNSQRGQGRRTKIGELILSDFKTYNNKASVIKTV